jgi:hypothetical protein
MLVWQAITRDGPAKPTKESFRSPAEGRFVGVYDVQDLRWEGQGRGLAQRSSFRLHESLTAGLVWGVEDLEWAPLGVFLVSSLATGRRIGV